MRSSVKSFRGEQEFTSAILSVTQAKAPKVVFTSGHGERKVDAARSREGFSEVAESLKADNCTVEEWATLGAAAVPEGADLVVVAGPRTPFTESERDVLKKYLDAGGRALFFLDVEFPPGTSSTLSDFGLGPLLTSLGVTLDSDVVVDPKNTLPMMGAETVFAKSFRSHPITKLLTGMPVVFPLAPSGTVPGDGTKPGEAPKKRARVVVFGDADWASNAGIANAANRLLLTSAVNWALERESLVAIPPKNADQVAVMLTRRDMLSL